MKAGFLVVEKDTCLICSQMDFDFIIANQKATISILSSVRYEANESNSGRIFQVTSMGHERSPFLDEKQEGMLRRLHG